MLILPVLAALLASASAAPNPRVGTVQSWPEGFVVNGNTAPRGTYIWQASLERCSSTGCSHSCGGSVISPNYVITAAHCVGSSASSYRIVVGMHVRNSGEGTTLNVASIQVHPSYSEDGTRGFPNDIAILRLQSVAPIDGVTVGAARLPASSSVDYVGTSCTISGWGRNSQANNNLPTTLLHATVNAITNAQCNTYVSVPLGGYHQCIKDNANYQGACNGDSGGPLNCDRGSGYEVAGVASWVIGNCLTEYPSCYTRVAYFRDWIRTNTGV